MPPWLTLPPGRSGWVTNFTAEVCGRSATIALPGVIAAFDRPAGSAAADSGVCAVQAARSGGRLLSSAAQLAFEAGASWAAAARGSRPRVIAVMIVARRKGGLRREAF